MLPEQRFEPRLSFLIVFRLDEGGQNEFRCAAVETIFLSTAAR
jgi:hypothetical protein